MLIQNKLVLFLTDHHLVESASLFSASQPKDLLVDPRLGIHCRSHRLDHGIIQQASRSTYQQDPGEHPRLLLMGITFLIYIGKVLVMFIYRGQFFLFDNRYSRDTLLNADVILVILLLITLYLLITVARQKYQLQRIQRLESDMQLRYYQNVSMLHWSIRSLRHDLSNHLAIPEGSYRDSLFTHLRSDRPSGPQPAFLAIHKDRRPVLPRKIRNLPLSAKHFAEEKASAGGSLHHRNRGHPSLYDPLTEAAVPADPETSGHVQADESNRQNPRRLRFLDERHKSLYLHVIPAFLKEESLAANHHC